MKIKRLKCTLLKVPWKYPLLGHDMTESVDFVEIETDTGVVGVSAANYPKGMVRPIEQFINNELEPLLIGINPLRTEYIQRRIYGDILGNYPTGIASCAASLIDIALWDIRGKATDLPIWQLLGGSEDKVEIYMQCGSSLYDLETLVGSAEAAVARGFKNLKMVVGRGKGGHHDEPTDQSLLSDVERVRAVREAIGPDIKLAVDAGCHPTLTQALRFCKQVEELNIGWFEDPLPRSDPRLLTELRSRTSVPLAAGSTGTCDLFHFREYLLNSSVDILQPNVRDIGGFTGGIKAVGMAQAFNKSIVLGGRMAPLNLHLYGGVASGALVEYTVRDWDVMNSLCLEKIKEPEGGWIEMPSAPGLGLEINWDVVKEFAR